ncbi:MAG: hypothetical protein O7I42_20375 [Alphaproteobacteria bacterium]|nr:hypothetical protein [Alphaproteobacteria bacterium]
MLGNIETLYAIHSRCMGDLPLTPDLRNWLANSLGRYLAHDCDNLNEAFGVIQGHGGIPWWRERAIRQRDAALRALSREAFGNISVYSRARAIAKISERYQTTCWPRDRLLDEMPERYQGTPKAHLWRAFASEAKMPVSERRLRTLLSD